MTNVQILAASEALVALSKERLPVRAAIKIAKMARTIGALSTDIINIRNGFVTDLGTLVDGEIRVPKGTEAWNVYIAKVQELHEMEQVVSSDTLDAAELGETITAETLLQLGPLLVLESDKPQTRAQRRQTSRKKR